MNNVTIVGKIQRINYAESGKMCFITIREKRNAEETNFLDVVCFSPDFIKRNFKDNSWIGINGHLHSNKHNEEYKTDVIADSIYFVGEKQNDFLNDEDIPF